MSKPRKGKAAHDPTRACGAHPDAECVLVLQGGGALGAYQGGVYQALSAAEREPDWVAGISIGAINSALIAGNPPGERLAKLRAFWEQVSGSLPISLPVAGMLPDARAALNEASAFQVLLFGVPGFFTPRFPPPQMRWHGTPQAISYYDTEPLRETLERLVDFDRINDGPMRLSVGAVNVRSGNFAYFDSSQQRIDSRHIMASGALPPGFAPVEIDGEHYWDGGLVSNTPLQYVLDQPGERHRVVFQVDLFPARGEMPAQMRDVSEREKDIRFSSRTRLNTTQALDRHLIAQAAQRLLGKLPASLRDDPDVQALARLRGHGEVDIAHLIYRSRRYERHSKDFEFSRTTMLEHWASGLADMSDTLADPRWTGHQPAGHGVHVFDFASEHREKSVTRDKPAPVAPETLHDKDMIR